MRGSALVLCAAVLTGCGGGSEASAPAPAAPPVTSAPQTQQVVVSFDRNGDGESDLLTLDAADKNLRIVSALDGSAAGGPVDVTPALEGTALDPEIVRSLKTYLANSLEVASETRLDVVDRSGRSLTITVYE